MLYLGSDHGGFHMKERLKKTLAQHGLAFTDLGAYTLQPDDDYPLIAARVGRAVIKHRAHRGILLCRSGVGANIVANKIPGVRAVHATEVWVAVRSRRDENTNILALPAEHLPLAKAWKIIHHWQKMKYRPLPRYQRRLNQIKKIERAPT